MRDVPLTLLLLTGAEPQRVSFVFGGDVIPHAAVKQVVQKNARVAEGADATLNHDGWDHVFGPLKRELSSADVTVVNLETPLLSRRVRLGDHAFAAPPALADALAAAGVDVATFANNHSLDQGRAGIVETREHLAAAGLSSAGSAASEDAAWAPLVLEVNGLRVGVLAFTRFLNDNKNARDASLPHVPLVHYRSHPEAGGINEKLLLEKVRAAAQTVDALIVTPHWGNEYQDTARDDDRRLAKALLEAGAVAIVGHHPHVLQSVVSMPRPGGEAGLVAFSLGNLVSNQDERDATAGTRDGMLLRFDLVRDSARAPVRIEHVGVVPLFTENRAAKKGRNVQPVLLSEERAAMQERLETLADRSDRASRAEAKALTKRLELATAREKRIRGLLGKAWRESAGGGVAVSATP